MAWIYAVASAKGGVGKTTTTANLSAALSAAGHDVAVVDADLAMPNLAAALGISDTDATVHDVLAGRSSIADATYTADAGVDVIPGDDSLDAFAAADPTELHAVLAELDAYDFVLVDTGSGLSHDAVLPLGLADAVFLVCNTERDALGDTDKTREVTERLGGTVAGVVLTRVDPENPNAEEVAARLDAPVIEAIPSDDAVTEAVAASTPVSAHAPDSLAATAYGALAEAVEAYDPGADVDGRDAVGSGDVEADASDETDDPDENEATEPVASEEGDADGTSTENEGQSGVEADAATGTLSIASAEAKLGIDDEPVASDSSGTEEVDVESVAGDAESDADHTEPVADAISEAESTDDVTDASETEAHEAAVDDEDSGVHDTALVAEAETTGLGGDESSTGGEVSHPDEPAESTGPSDPAQSDEPVDATDGQDGERGDEEAGEAESESDDGENTGFLGRLLR